MRQDISGFPTVEDALLSNVPLYFPAGIWQTDPVSVGVVDWLGEDGSVLDGDVIFDGVTRGRVQQLKMFGKTTLLNLSRSVFDQTHLSGQVRYVGDGEYVGDNLFRACELSQAPGSPEPIIWFTATHGEVNENSFLRCRFQTNGSPQAPAIILEHVTSQSYMYGNTFRDCSFELASAGGIHLFGAFGTVIDKPAFYDAVAYSDHPILLHKRPAGSQTKHTTINSYMRASGSLNSGVYDIRQWDAHSTRIEQYANVQATGNRISLNNFPSIVDGVHPTQVEVVGGGKAKVTTY